MKFIAFETRKDTGQTWYVCARPGWYRRADGTFQRDGSVKGGPEWTKKREHALEFETHRAAARVAGKNPSSKVQEI